MDTKYYEIDDDVVARAAECEKRHVCLESEAFKPCNGQYVSLERFCCLKEPCDEQCIYCLQLGNESICGCPVRVEIFNKYRM